ncbi:uncharacterized protein LOC119068907 [Bradysia coprophila]|uniref:uncharacterized protein LOC119068907 n=1 Tax=Bradysia coprophila TaxID=38358 RepID=UPI00187D9000|nr:uncharacterized protein LOC119068907 [Bradysia coprophila]
MDVHKSLLGKFKLSEVKIDPIFDEKGKSHDAPPVFSAKFWADPSLSKKELVIYAYKVKNWIQLAEALNSEFSVNVTSHIIDEVKQVFWETLLSRPMEFEVVQMIENELYFPNNETEFMPLVSIALDQEFFCNFQQIISINRTTSRKCEGWVMSCIESHILSQLKIKNFDQFTITSANNNVQINILKYIICYDKLEADRQKTLINKFLALEPLPIYRDFFEIVLGILNDNGEVFNEKFTEYVELFRFVHPDKELGSIITADSNLIVVKAFASELQNILTNVIKNPIIDINRLMIPHYRFFKSFDVPFPVFVALLGYNELLQATIESSKDIKTVFRDAQDNETTLLTFCIRGFKYNKRLSARSDISTDFDDCIDILLKSFPDDTFIRDHHNPMDEAVKYNNDNAAIKLIQKFGLTHRFVQVINTKVLTKYLDGHVHNSKVGISVNYRFLKDETIKIVMRKNTLKTSIQHPVIANYVELKYSQFWPLHVTDFLLFIIFSVISPTLYFFMRNETQNANYLLHSSILYSFLRFGLQVALFYYSLLIPNLSNSLHQDPSGDSLLPKPLRRSRILAGLTEVLILFLLMGFLFSHLFTNRPEYLFSGSMLLMTIEMTKMLSRISPSNVSKYILMFKTVAATLLITMGIFFWIIIAFTLAFHVVIYVGKTEEISKLDNLWTSFTTIMTIFMGGHDGEALKFKGLWNLMLFTMFVLIAISVYNLAIDLAMEKAKLLRDNGDFVSLEKQFNLILEYGTIFKIGSEPITKIIYIRRPDETTIIEELIWRIDTSIVKRLKGFDPKNRWNSETVQITQLRYSALSAIVKSNEEQLIRTDNNVKIEEIEKTVHQIEDFSLRMEHKLNVLRQESDSRRGQLKQMRNGLSKLETKFDIECKHRHKQLNRILAEMEQLNRHMNEIRSFQLQSKGE